MRSKLCLMFSVIFLMAFTCDDDDDSGNDDGSNNFIEYLGTRYEGNSVVGGCNVEDLQSEIISCSYVGGFFGESFNYTVSIYHLGGCSTGTFNMLGYEDLDINDFASGDAAFTMAVTEDTVTVELFEGISGTIELIDAGTSTSMRFSGEIQSLSTGAINEIEGYIQCNSPILTQIQ